MARIVSTQDTLLIGAGDLLYQFALDKNELKEVSIQQYSDQLPKIPKFRETNDHGVDDDSNERNTVKFQCLCMAVSPCRQLLAVGTTHKTLLVFTTTDLTLKRSLHIPKAPTSVTFDRTSKFVVVGDRSGHVCRYSMDTSLTIYGHKEITGEMCNYEGEPLMGAITMVLDIAVSPDNKYLIVADRDEKLRIHRYPKAFVIEALGLGHSQYVASVAFLGNRLFSSGGDLVLKEWDVTDGKEQSSIDLPLKNPVKKIIGCSQLNKIVMIEDKTCNLIIVAVECKAKTVIEGSSELLDVCVIETKCFCLSRNGIIVCDLSSPSPGIEYLYKEDNFVKNLAEIEEPITNYFKNCKNDNMDDYRKRKVEKMLKGKNKKRKNQVAGGDNGEDAEVC